MGQLVRTYQCNLTIKKESEEEAYKALKNFILESNDEFKKWFKFEKLKKTSEILQYCIDGAEIIDDYRVECEFWPTKTVQEDEWYRLLPETENILKLLAPYMEDGSCMRWSTEEDELFGYRYNNGKILKILGVTTWIDIK